MKTIRKVIVVSVLTMALTSCSTFAPKPTNTLQQTATNLPTLISTVEPAITPAPTENLTETPKPSKTPEPIVVNAHEFMDPILVSIKDRLPDYQDDFSDPHSGWPSGRQPPNGHEEGILGYENGEYFVMADAAKFPFERNPGEKITCLSAFHNPQINVLDFVMEVDARFITHLSYGNWQIKFWDETDHYHGVQMEYYEWIGINTNAPLPKSLGENDLRETGLPQSFRKTESNHLVIVAKGSKIAMTLNDQVVVFMDEFPPHKRGPISLVVCNLNPSPFRAQWDNLKIWNLPQ